MAETSPLSPAEEYELGDLTLRQHGGASSTPPDALAKAISSLRRAALAESATPLGELTEAPAHLRLALVLRATARTDSPLHAAQRVEARDLLRAATALAPRDAAAAAALGMCELDDFGDAQAAADAAASALRIAPGHPTASMVAGLAALGREDTQAAIPHLRAAAAGGDARALTCLGAVLLHTPGHRAEAGRILREARAARPDDPTVASNLALSLKAEGDVAGAAALLEEVLRKHPEHVAAAMNLTALALLETGDRALAVRCREVVARACAGDADASTLRLRQIDGLLAAFDAAGGTSHGLKAALAAQRAAAASRAAASGSAPK